MTYEALLEVRGNSDYVRISPTEFMERVSENDKRETYQIPNRDKGLYEETMSLKCMGLCCNGRSQSKRFNPLRGLTMENPQMRLVAMKEQRQSKVGRMGAEEVGREKQGNKAQILCCFTHKSKCSVELVIDYEGFEPKKGRRDQAQDVGAST